MSDSQIQKIPGTTWLADRQKWKAQLRLSGKLTNLGYFATQEEAGAAVQAARESGKAPATKQRILAATKTERAIAEHNRKKKTVALSNVLLMEPLRMGFLESRMFVLMLRSLHAHDQELQRILIPLADFSDDGGKSYSLVRQACKMMVRRVLMLPQPDAHAESLHEITLLDSIKLEVGKGMVTGRFSESVKPYLLDLAGNYTIGHVEDLMQLRSANTHRFYWLFSMWFGQRKGKPVKLTVEELRHLTTGADKYPQWSDYRRVVLEPAIQELQEFGFSIAVREVRLGRAVNEVEFVIDYEHPLASAEEPQPVEPQAAPATAQDTFEAWLEQPDHEKLIRPYKRLGEHQVEKTVAQRIIRHIGLDEEKLKIFNREMYRINLEKNEGKIMKIGGYTVDELRKAFRLQKF